MPASPVLPEAHTLGLAFLAGFAGTAHCAGMCGALVLTVGRQAPGVRAQLVYACGRVLAYGFLGALFGVAGATAVGAAALAGLQGWFYLAAGLAVVTLAVFRLGPWGEVAPGVGSLGRLHSALWARLPSGSSTSLLLLLGIFNSLVPCGLLTSMELRAAATGSPLGGALLLWVFGLGTLPFLALLGTVGGRLAAPRRVLLDRVASLVVILLGLQIVLRGAAQLHWIHLASRIPNGIH